MKFAAAGDMLVQRRISEGTAGVAEIQQWMEGCHMRFFNLETTLHREGECFGNALCGGSYLRMDPEVLDDCKRYGFNCTSFCNNHAMDFAYEGLVKTYDHVQKSGLVQAGTGRNLDQAAAPAYLDTPDGRIALIAMTSSGNDSFDDTVIAGQQSRRVPGRPGVNLLRIKQTLYVTQSQMDALKAIADATGVNDSENIARGEGYRDALPAGQFKLGKHVDFRVADHAYGQTVCHPDDLKRMEKAICEAKLFSDYIVVSIHSHQVGGVAKEEPSQFLKEFAHFCIDKGADAVVGHGPHLLRPIEIYEGKPIFYSLGDFVIQNENIPFLPEDYYRTQDLTSDDTMRQVFTNRSRNFTRGLQTDRRAFETVLPRWEVEDGKLIKLELLALEMSQKNSRSTGGIPVPAKDDRILRYLAAMSEPYGTKMEITGNTATVLL